MKRYLLIYLFSTVTLLAFQQGDILDSQTNQALEMEKGKVYIVDFFASWCHSCKRELPILSKLSQQLDHKRVQLIGVDVDENEADAKIFQRNLQAEKKLSFKVINDPDGKIVSHFKPVGIPALYIIKDEKVIAILIGAKDHINTLILQHIKDIP